MTEFLRIFYFIR